MIKRIFYIVLFIYWILLHIYITLIPNKIFNIPSNLSKQIAQIFGTQLLTDGFDTKFYIDNDITNEINQNSNLVDIIVCNHISGIDFLFIMTLLQKFGIKNFNFVLKKDIIWIPGLGYGLHASTDIKLSRNWEEDSKNINLQLDNILNNEIKEKQVIIIFIEGTRYTKTKFLEGQKYSQQNNLPVFNNLLVPKTKGLWTITNYLANKKKLGNIWDMSIICEDIKKSRFLKIDSVFTIIKKLDLNINYQNNLLFKNWVIKNWEFKDNQITNFKNLNWELISINNNNKNMIFIITITIIGTIILFNKYGLIYYGSSVFIGYLSILLSGFYC